MHTGAIAKLATLRAQYLHPKPLRNLHVSQLMSHKCLRCLLRRVFQIILKPQT